MRKDLLYWQAYVRERVRIDPRTGCWEWQLCCDDEGYGRCAGARRYGLDQRAHRLSFTVFKGPIPKGKLVRHRCHNKPCCNPAHLRAGTDKDNKDDNRRDGLPLTTLIVSPAKVRAIRRRLAQGRHTQRQLAALFNVSQPTISRISTARIHAHI